MDVKQLFLGCSVTVILTILSHVSCDSQFLWLPWQHLLKAESIWMKQFYNSNLNSLLSEACLMLEHDQPYEVSNWYMDLASGLL